MHGITIFNHATQDEEQVEAFYDFFVNNGLSPLFTDQHRTSNISVSYLELRSVIVSGNKANKLLLEFADVISMNQNNKMYQEAMFELLNRSTTLNMLVENIRKLLQFIQTEIEDEHQFNKWNIVFYNDIY